LGKRTLTDEQAVEIASWFVAQQPNVRRATFILSWAAEQLEEEGWVVEQMGIDLRLVTCTKQSNCAQHNKPNH
jgi:hypothetical protein